MPPYSINIGDIMIGKKFGMLIIINDSGKRSKDRGMIWTCRCECGKVKDVSYKFLKNEKKPRSCGCSRRIASDKIFLSNIDNSKDCWIWKGVKNKGGYGRIGTKELATRRSYKYFIGEIPKGKQVCHTCDNRICVNPNHLFLGSIGDNMRDRTSKGRQAKGSKIGNSILTEDMVYEIRKTRLEGKSYKELMEKFNLSFYMIRCVCKNRQWNHVPLGEECSKFISPHDKNQKQHNFSSV